jgi:GGDEF domain-containing protein
MWLTSRLLPDLLVAPLAVLVTAGFTGLAVIYLMQDRQETGRSQRRIGSQLEQHIRNGKRIIIHDPETSLLQRWYLELRVLEEIQRCDRYGMSMSILLIRGDQQKQRDDEPPFAAEMSFVQLFSHALRSMDMAAKLGEREYVICLPHADEDGAAAVARRLIEKRRPDQSFLIGMAVHPREGNDLEALLERARRSLAAEVPETMTSDAANRRRYAEILHAVSHEPSGEIPVKAGETARGLKLKLRRAAKRAGVELSIWERAGTIYYAYKKLEQVA